MMNDLIIITMHLAVLLIVVFIESVVIGLFLRKTLVKSSELFLSVLLVNLITFPPAQMITYLLIFKYEMRIEACILAIELLQIAAKYFLVRWQFNGMRDAGHLTELLSGKKTFLAVFVASLCSSETRGGLLLAIAFIVSGGQVH